MNRIALALTIILLLLPTAQAADIETSDSCTLADAITAANTDEAAGECPAGDGADIISLSDDITLAAALPQITTEITIEGNGFTISGNNRYRIFYNDGGLLTINDLTMTKGYVEGELILEDESLKNVTANPIGAAIVNWEGTVIIISSSFSDNVAEYLGGAIANAEYGMLSISDSSFSDNLAEWGGAIYNDGELSITNSTFSNNAANACGAVFNGGELSITNSTFSGNSTEYNDGGAICNSQGGELSIVSSAFSGNSTERIGEGGAIINGGELTLRNSTFSHNWSEYGGGGAIDNDGKLSIINSTFSGNSTERKDGGTISNSANGYLRIINSIIAGRGGNACHSESRLRHNIRNFIQDGTCSPDFEGDPMLGELVEPEDGSPAYFPLLEGSPAIDAADDEYCPDTDMLGAARPQGAACDIGAYERPQ